MRARMHVIGESVVFFNDTATTEIYTLSLHDASSDLSERPWSGPRARAAPGSPSPATLGSARDLKGPCAAPKSVPDRKSTRLNSSHANISYAVFCLKKTITLRSHLILSVSLPSSPSHP